MERQQPLRDDARIPVGRGHGCGTVPYGKAHRSGSQRVSTQRTPVSSQRTPPASPVVWESPLCVALHVGSGVGLSRAAGPYAWLTTSPRPTLSMSTGRRAPAVSGGLCSAKRRCRRTLGAREYSNCRCWRAGSGAPSVAVPHEFRQRAVRAALVRPCGTGLSVRHWSVRARCCGWSHSARRGSALRSPPARAGN